MKIQRDFYEQAKLAKEKVAISRYVTAFQLLGDKIKKDKHNQIVPMPE
jgi:hypothetical protein